MERLVVYLLNSHHREKGCGIKLIDVQQVFSSRLSSPT
jgi:hypothetical protein